MARRGGRLGEGSARGQASAASSRCISAALPPFHSSRLIVPASHQRLVGGRGEQGLAERGRGAAEGDPLEALAVVAAGDPADMAVADDAELDQPRRAGGDPRPRPAGAIGPGRVERVAQARRDPARREPGVEQQRAAAARLARRRRRGARGGRRAAARARPARSVSPAAMAWPPPAISRPLSLAASTAAPRSTPLIERPEPLPVPSSLLGDDDRRAAEAFLEAAGDDADHAGVPAARP